MSKIHFIESKYNDSLYLQRSLMTEFKDDKMDAYITISGFEEAKSMLKVFSSEDIFVIDIEREDEKKLYPFFRKLQGIIKYPKVILLVDSSVELSQKEALFRNSIYDQIQVLNKKIELNEVRTLIKSWLSLIVKEKTSRNLQLIAYSGPVDPYLPI